jgi:myxalamid-type polyketide synthase MxaE and MxaD
MLENVSFLDALPAPDETTRTLQITLSDMRDGASLAQIFALDDAEADVWSVKAKASVLASAESVAPLDLEALKGICTEVVDIKNFYETLAHYGLRYGPAFRGVQEAWRGENQALARLTLPEAAGDPRDYLIHPALLDAAFHGAAAALGEGASEAERIFLPVAVERYQVLASPTGRVFWSYVTLRPDAPGDLAMADVLLLDDAGRALADVRGLQLKPVSTDALLRSLSQQRVGDWLYRLEWRRQPLESTAPLATEPGWWLIFVDGGDAARAIAAGLEAGGDETVLVEAGDAFGSTSRAWVVDPFRPGDFERLLAALQPQHPLPPRGVIYAWGLDSGRDVTDAAGLAGALHLTQKLLLAGWSDKPRLWLLTANAQPAGEARVDAASSPLWAGWLRSATPWRRQARRRT